ncbi:MAG: general secretion pathway protein GspK, partial [bacterium]|nr:general secretion pathway protein GspK [bacterium]
DAESRVSVNAATEELLEEIPELGFRSVSQITRRRGGDDGEPAHPFVAIEEVRYLEGIDDDTWFGYGDGTPLYDILTVWGDGRINLNTASRKVLECVPDLEDNAIEAIMMYRTGGDGELFTGDDLAFRDMERIAEITGLSAEEITPLDQYCKVESQFFTIKGLATQRQGAVRAECTAVVHVGEGIVVVLDWREGISGL